MRFLRLVICTTLWVAISASTAAAATSAAVFSGPELGLPDVAVTALAKAKGHLYVGLRSYDSARKNLAVIQLDAQNRPQGVPLLFRDANSSVVLPSGADSAVSTVIVHPRQPKLYLLWRDSRTDLAATKPLTVYDLDANGVRLAGDPRGYAVDANISGAASLLAALHPSGKMLYLVAGGSYLYLCPLDAAGEPTAIAHELPGGWSVGIHSVTVNAAGDKLYLGASPDKLIVVDVSALSGEISQHLENGTSVVTQRTFDLEPNAHHVRYFRWSPKALYDDDLPANGSAREGRTLTAWPLDANGYPSNVQGTLARGTTLPALDVVAISPDTDASRNLLWVAELEHAVDAVVSGTTAIRGAKAAGFELDAQGLPRIAPGSDSPLPPGQEGPVQRCFTAAVSAIGDDGSFVFVKQPVSYSVLNACLALNVASGYRIRVTVDKATNVGGGNRSTVDARVPHATPADLGTLSVGVPSQWVEIDDLLKGKSGPVMAVVEIAEKLDDLSITVDVSLGRLDSNSQPIVDTFVSESLKGSKFELLIPGYSFEPLSARLGVIETFTDHAARLYRDSARAVAISDRPQLFPVSCYHLMGGEGSKQALASMAEAVSSLGCNTMNAYDWEGVKPPIIDSTLRGFGITRRQMATSVYLGNNTAPTFDYEYYATGSLDLTWLDQWARQQVRLLSDQGATPADVVQIHIADEPGWYTPEVLDQVKNNSHYLARFHDYLRAKDPAHYGGDLSGVVPIGPGQGYSLEDLGPRRLYYWTTRFFSEAAAAHFQLIREALLRAGFRSDMVVYPNLNNALSGHFTPSPGKKIGNSPTIGNETGMGAPGWFDVGRREGISLWCDPSFSDPWSQQWSVLGDQMRSAAALKGRPFGAYVRGQGIGLHPEGASYKLLSLIGHGAKRPDLYTFGTQFLFDEGWSEQTASYGQIGKAFQRIARAERLLYPGTRARGKVALQVGENSRLWEKVPPGSPVQRNRLYEYEAWFLHYALTHEGYTVDFISDSEFDDGDILTARGYAVLYLTQPNVTGRAQETIRKWVAAGGTVVVLPGAASANEINNTHSGLDPVLGLIRRLPFRYVPAIEPLQAGAGSVWPSSGRLTFNGASAFGSGTLDIRSPLQCGVGDPDCFGGLPLQVQTATVLAATAAGPAITQHAYGKGMAYAYGICPGLEYWLTASWIDPHRMPQGWGAAQRQLALAPVKLAKTPRSVVASVPGVEVARLDSRAGIAVVLLNWTDQPIPALEVRIDDARRFPKVTSNEGVPLSVRYAGNSAIVTLPLNNVEILMLEPNR